MNSSLRLSLLAAAIAALPIAADAAGLGRLTVLSGLGQPLRAEVALSVTPEELTSLSARLAPPEAYQKAGVEFSPTLAGIKFNVLQKPNGQAVLQLSSDRPVNEPFVDMLIELNWSAGRLVREYTFLLDPPEAVIARQAAPTQPAPEAKPAKPAAAPEAQPAPEAKPTPAATAKPEGGNTHEVVKGETLGKIAAESRHEGVSLDQMLVAIFRGNPDAFIGENMNRMRSGKILQIPEREEVAGIEQSEARKVVVAHSADFNAYRQKLAAAAAAAPAPQEQPAQQAAGGKITPQVEDKTAPPAEQRDRLQVSKSESAKEPKAAADKAAQTKIASLEEDVVAKEKAVQEANARVAALEKNVGELQKLIEMQNRSLADLQKQAESAKGAAAGAAKPQAAAAPPAEPPKAAEAPKPAESAKVAEPPRPAEPVAAAPQPEKPAPAPAPAVEPPKPAPKPEAAKKPALPAEEPGFFASLMDNPTALAGGGGVLALLLGWAALKMRQRRKDEAPLPTMTTTAPSLAAQSVFGSTGGQSVDTSGSSIQTDFSQSGMTTIDADEGVDPVAEADVYMAYGRDAQAEEILLDALKNEPTRHAIHVKLLEIYAQRKNVKQFETLASELYAQTGGQGSEWEKAAALGRKLDPNNPLYGTTAAPAKAERAAAVPDPMPAAVGIAAGAAALAATDNTSEKLQDTWAMPGDFARVASGDQPVTGGVGAPAAGPAAASLDFELDLGSPAQSESAVEVKPAAVPAESAIQFSDQASPRLEPSVEAPRAATASQVDDVEKTAIGTMFDFTLDLGEPGAQPAQPASADTANPEVVPVVDLERADIGAEMLDIAPDDTAASTQQAGGEVVDLERTDIGTKLLDFNLGSTGAKQRRVPEVDLEKTEITSSILDFNLQLDAPPEPGVPNSKPASVLDFSGIDLNLDATPADRAAAVEDPEAETKIELARAYEEMGDREGARELLQEVLKEGNSLQKQRAQDLLVKLG